MKDNYKDFDECFRAALENAEEEVPRQLCDAVFERLDAVERRRVLPLWLRRASAVAAAAAAVLLAVVLWPDNSKESLVSEDIAVDEGKTQEALADVLELNSEPAMKAASDETETGWLAETAGQVRAQADAGQMPAHAKSGSAVARKAEVQAEQDEAGEALKAEDGSRPEEIIGNEDAEKEDNEGYFDWEEPEKRRKAGKASIVLSGDLSSNGDARSISRFHGFRAPALNIQDRTWIEQTGEDSRYAIPVSVGIGARYQFARRWSAGTGISYTMLSRTFPGVYCKNVGGIPIDRISTDIRHNIHYIGIPVNIYYDIIDSKRVKFYAYGGGAVDFPVSNVFKVKAPTEEIILKEKVKGAQYSVGAGIGVEFMLTKFLGLYLDPGFNYYFKGDQPVSIRTQQPFMMNFELGFRFDI
ncbi:MAG: outer membrane beta-barrel protein [Candidatus Cryptobacteroides sp.]|nr:outer membrane beta-barrel protein [Bacteroidales bacterium]MDY4572928.1 outer membrane beta-barrel protein [Candidatus Cryptobacteroides sp.]MDY5495646.1 outer membrane beta-barrel protein [Candidatus Cryptobacteroides sp.]